MAKKRIKLILILCLCAMFVLGATFVYLAVFSPQILSDLANGCSGRVEISYKYNEDDNSYSVSDIFSYVKTVEIPAEYNGLPVKKIDLSSRRSDVFNPGKEEKLILPNSIEEITDYSLVVLELKEFIVDENNKNYKSIDGNLYNKDASKIIRYANKKSDKNFTIPDSVTSIEDSAFYLVYRLTNITIPDSVTNIGEWAFNLCISLTSVTIGKGVTSIGKYAFAGDYDNHMKLTSIIFNGTKEQWNTIDKGNDWNKYVPATVAHCADGDVEL